VIKETRRLRILDFLIRDELRDALYLISSGHRSNVAIAMNRAIERMQTYSASTLSIDGDFSALIIELEFIKAKSFDDEITDEQLKFLVIQTYAEIE